jgi:Zn-dependent membrane protease YugP
VWYAVSLLFDSICYFVITRLTFYNTFLCLFLGFLLNILCSLCFCIVLVLFRVLFLLLYIAVSFIFLYKSTDHCHRVETQLQPINISKGLFQRNAQAVLPNHFSKKQAVIV